MSDKEKTVTGRGGPHVQQLAPTRLVEATANTDSACHTAVVVALNTAMRKDEIRNLRWAQIDWEKRVVTVGKSKTTAGTGRIIPPNPLAFAALIA